MHRRELPSYSTSPEHAPAPRAVRKPRSSRSVRRESFRFEFAIEYLEETAAPHNSHRRGARILAAPDAVEWLAGNVYITDDILELESAAGSTWGLGEALLSSALCGMLGLGAADHSERAPNAYAVIKVGRRGERGLPFMHLFSQFRQVSANLLYYTCSLAPINSNPGLINASC